MATHKVPQDVETEDKLIGFLSMKQFIFVVVGLGFGYLTFFFATKVNVFVSIIWVPFTIVPLVLGLYQRKDQPVETFLASAIRFYFKPRRRKWDQEGYEDRVVVTAPPKVEHHYTKDFSGAEAVSRLTKLSHMMDSRGWASKLTTDWQNPQLAAVAASDGRLIQPNQVADSTAYLQNYMQPADIMDENTSVVARGFQTKIDETNSAAHVRAVQAVQQAQSTPSVAPPTDTDATEAPVVNKYPEMHQTVIQPEAPVEPSPEPADTPQGSKPTEDTPKVEAEQKKEVIPTEPIAHIEDDGSVEISLH